MLRRLHRDRLLLHVDSERQQLFIDVRKMSRDEVGVLMADVEVDIVEPRPLDLVVVRARDDVARREFGACVIIGHVAAAGNGVLEDSPFAAHRSEEHPSELPSLMRIPYAVFCLKKKNYNAA